MLLFAVVRNGRCVWWTGARSCAAYATMARAHLALVFTDLAVAVTLLFAGRLLENTSRRLSRVRTP